MVKRTDHKFSTAGTSRRQFLAGTSAMALALAFAGTASLSSALLSSAFAQAPAPKEPAT